MKYFVLIALISLNMFGMNSDSDAAKRDASGAPSSDESASDDNEQVGSAVFTNLANIGDMRELLEKLPQLMQMWQQIEHERALLKQQEIQVRHEEVAAKAKAEILKAEALHAQAQADVALKHSLVELCKMQNEQIVHQNKLIECQIDNVAQLIRIQEQSMHQQRQVRPFSKGKGRPPFRSKANLK